MQAVMSDASLVTLLEAIAGMVTEAYDYKAFTYVPSGNGAGEVATIVFKTGGSGGVTVATITFAYNSDHEVTSVTKT